MSTRDPRTLIEKLKALAPERVAEVADFADFLGARDAERTVERAAMRVAEPSFASVWDNDDDAAYDRLQLRRQRFGSTAARPASPHRKETAVPRY